MPLFRFDSEGAIEDGFSVRAVKAAVEWAVGKGVEVSKHVNSQKKLVYIFHLIFFCKSVKIFFCAFLTASLFFFSHNRIQMIFWQRCGRCKQNSNE